MFLGIDTGQVYEIEAFLATFCTENFGEARCLNKVFEYEIEVPAIYHGFQRR